MDLGWQVLKELGMTGPQTIALLLFVPAFVLVVVRGWSTSEARAAARLPLDDDFPEV